MALDPYHLTPAASVNRVKIVEAPGLPAELRGKAAYALLGHRTLSEQIAKMIPALRESPDIPLAFNAGYQTHPAAEAIAREMGRRLGYFLCVLKRGEAANRAARPEWDESYWAYWGSVEHIILGGGLMAGWLGPKMVAHAREALGEACTLEISPYAAILPLLGAARNIPVGDGAAVVFDFGQTAVKRARAVYGRGMLTHLEKLPNYPPPDSAAMLQQMVTLIAETWTECGGDMLAPYIVASLASYVQNGQPASDGVYGNLRQHAEDVTASLSAEVSRAVQKTVALSLLHDGTAAAHACAGVERRTAVITLGTALGVGFPPPDGGLRKLSPTFTVSA